MCLKKWRPYQVHILHCVLWWDSTVPFRFLFVNIFTCTHMTKTPMNVSWDSKLVIHIFFIMPCIYFALPLAKFMVAYLIISPVTNCNQISTETHAFSFLNLHLSLAIVSHSWSSPEVRINSVLRILLPPAKCHWAAVPAWWSYSRCPFFTHATTVNTTQCKPLRSAM